MADETMTETPADAANANPANAPAPKKTRAPRRPKAAPEAVSGDVTAVATETPVKKTRAKRGSKQIAAKTEKSTATPKKAATRSAGVKAVAAAPVAAVEFTDDIADLIKLEEENQQLRKKLSEKLRAENANLRKRLGEA
jgi:ribosomal protein S1